MPTNRNDLVAATLTNAAGQSEVYGIGGVHCGRVINGKFYVALQYIP
jgi:hypothetical protein